ncbi:hypothetical protein [Actinoplanes sp. GCM10030250]|uniref:hypothetical protein n=1 Tax=Actinoplanes sp. GCM10030250 TaxID=3273376 RepID=UPI003606B908
MTTAPEPWKTLSKGDGGVVLAVDFDTTGRPEARFADLVANAGSGLEFRETVPLPATRAQTRTAREYLDWWGDPLAAERPRVAAVLGYCAGGVYAAALADRVDSFQDGQVPVILFDPEITVEQTLLWQFNKMAGFLSATIPAAQLAKIKASAEEVFDRDNGIAALRDDLMTLAHEGGEPAFARLGLSPARVAELFGAFDSFMSFLAAAAEIDPFARWKSATVITSASPASGLNGIRSAGIGIGQIPVGREIFFDVEHSVMLADREIAAAVLEMLHG